MSIKCKIKFLNHTRILNVIVSPSWHLSLISFQSYVLNLRFLEDSMKTEQRGLDFTYLTFGEKCPVPGMQLKITK